MSKKIVALLPMKANSTRVKGKNFRDVLKIIDTKFTEISNDDGNLTQFKSNNNLEAILSSVTPKDDSALVWSNVSFGLTVNLQKTLDDLREMQAEILVTLTGIDETFAQTVLARFSYTPDEIEPNARFEDMLNYDEKGKIVVSLCKIDDFTKANESTS